MIASVTKLDAKINKLDFKKVREDAQRSKLWVCKAIQTGQVSVRLFEQSPLAIKNVALRERLINCYRSMLPTNHELYQAL